MGYYRAGGFMDILGAGAGIASSFFPAAAPLIGFGSKVLGGIFGGSKQDAPVANSILSGFGIIAKGASPSVQPGTKGATVASAKATPVAQTVGRNSELFTLNQAPGRMPMEGSAPGASTFSKATEGGGNDELLQLLLQLLAGKKPTRKKKRRRY